MQMGVLSSAEHFWSKTVLQHFPKYLITDNNCGRGWGVGSVQLGSYSVDFGFWCKYLFTSLRDLRVSKDELCAIIL